MKLEEEIAQRNFKNDYHKLAVNIMFTNNWLCAHYDSRFKDSSLTGQQFNVLRILRGQHPNPCNLKLIKERMLDRMSDVSRIVDKLVAKKLVDRKECPTDRRNVDILINDTGLEILKTLDFVDEEIVSVLSNLTPQEVVQLNHLLDKMRK